MNSQVTTTPHPESKPKTDEEKKAMVRKQTTEERIKFLTKLNRNKYDKDHEESIRTMKDLVSRDEDGV